TTLQSTATDLDIAADAGAITLGSGVAFSSPGTYISTASPQNIDATGSTFGGFDPSTGDPSNAADLAQFFAIEDKIDHKLDDAARGFVREKDGNVFVTQDSGSIQRAIDAADAGDTVWVDDGEFHEDVTVNKVDLLVQGSGA